jgi:hypothetical protein
MPPHMQANGPAGFMNLSNGMMPNKLMNGPNAVQTGILNMNGNGMGDWPPGSNSNLFNNRVNIIYFINYK